MVHRYRLLALTLLVSLHALAATRSVFDAPRIILGSDGDVVHVRTADLNKDGKMDIAVLGHTYSSMEFRVLLGNGDGTFRPAVVTQLPWFAGDFDVADLTGDTIPDVAFVHESSNFENRVNVYRGAGDGSFTPNLELSLAKSCWTKTVALADVTSDGRPDILTCGLAVYKNNGNGTFAAPIFIDAGSSGDISVVDVNGDGKNDVVLQRGGLPQTAYMLGLGNGSFLSPVAVDAPGPSVAADFDLNGRADFAWIDEWNLDLGVRLGSNGRYDTRVSGGFVGDRGGAITSGDLDKDGRPDIIASYNGHLYVWITKPDGTPGTLVLYLAGCAGIPATADFDGDGYTDVVLAGFGDAFDVASIQVLRNAGDGTFRAPRSQLMSSQYNDGRYYGSGPHTVALGDVTRDGKIDQIVLTDANIAVFPGAGNGTFGAPVYTAANLSYDHYVAFGDFDADGLLDLVTNSGVNLECWLANGDGTYRKAGSVARPSGLRIAAGDFNGDGNLDVVGSYEGDIELFAGRGNGTFDPVIIANPDNLSWNGFLTGDVNNDGRDDVVFDSAILLGSATGAFTFLSYDSYYPPAALVDLDEDGNLDIVKHDPFINTTTVMIQLGNGDGTFGAMNSIESDLRGSVRPLQRALVGDFNSDGNVDLAFDTTVLLGDGAGSFNGYARFRRAGELSSSAAADIDGNGSDDLVLVNWSHAVDVLPTWKTDSLDLPLSIAFADLPSSIPAGDDFDVTVTTTGEGCFTPNGGIVIRVGGVISAIAEPVGGHAMAEVRGETVGVEQLTASFGNDAVYAAANATPVSVEFTKASSWMYGTASPSPALTTDVVHVVGTVQSFITTRPTGTVAVTLDGAPAGEGRAPEFDVVLGKLAPGTHTIKVQYSGDELHLPATLSAGVSVVKPQPAITFSVNPSPVNAGSNVTLTANFPNDSAIVGVVNFYDGATHLGQVPISSGTATLTTNTLTAGTHFLQATFPGNDFYRGISAGKSLTVNDVPIPSSASSLYLVTPCRIIDTRGPQGPYGGPSLPSRATRSVQVTNACGIPFGAKAVAVNVTVIAPQQEGFLTLFPGVGSMPQTSTINFRKAKVRANNAIASLSAGGILKVYNGSNVTVQFIIDVTGYFQ